MVNSMAQVQEFFFHSSDGHGKLHGIRWLPDSGEPKAVLQIAHGVAEYVARYDLFARFLADSGFAVVGNDHLGHGKSAPSKEDKGFFADKDGWNTVVKDMHLLYEQERAQYRGCPYFLLGHSMGSFLARTYLIKYPGELAGCIISGTGSQPLALCNFGLFAARLERLRLGPRGKSKFLDNLSFGSYNKRITPHRTPNDWLSRDSMIVDKYYNDEDCGFISSVSLFSDMLSGIKYISDRKNLQKMQKDLPILFMSGEMDPVGSYGKGVTAAYQSFLDAGCTDVTLKLYPEGRHEMLNETNKEEVYADIRQWLESKLTIITRP